VLRIRRVRGFATLIALALSVVLIAPAVPAEAAAKVPAKFTINGSGSGHGAGMSQYGAYQLARTGSTAEQILALYYPGTYLGTAVNNPRTVKVQVFGPPTDKRTSTSVKVKGGGFTVSDGMGKTLGTFNAGTAKLKVKGSQVSAKIKSRILKASRLVLTPMGSAVATVTGAQGGYRHGNLQATVIGKKLNVVNEVAMNTAYLYGLDEMPASWGTYGGAEALKAQVIAARNYIIKAAVKGTSAACDCDVFDDERSQNYTGWKKAGKAASQPWIDAVDATITSATVQMLRDPSAGFAETPYFASTGNTGQTGANSDVFGTAALSYLGGVADPYSAQAPGNPHKSWKRTLTQAKAAKIFGLKKIKSLEVTERYPGGLVRSISATAANGKTKTLTKTTTAWTSVLGVPAPWISGITGK